MARVSFSSLMEEITGKLAGSVFQDSYGGFQVRTRVKPRNIQSNYQQLRRGEFGFISSLWRTLDAVQRQTFIDAAGTLPAALDLFIGSNVNLTLINEPIITDYIPGAVPLSMAIDITSATAVEFNLLATGAITTVPAGNKLLIQATNTRFITGIFLNPSMFSPIVDFDEGEDMSVIHDVITNWNDRYGQLNAGLRICIKSALIDKINGTRGPEIIFCINSLVPVANKIEDSDGTFVVDSDGTFVVSQ